MNQILEENLIAALSIAVQDCEKRRIESILRDRLHKDYKTGFQKGLEIVLAKARSGEKITIK